MFLLVQHKLFLVSNGRHVTLSLSLFLCIDKDYTVPSGVYYFNSTSNSDQCVPFVALSDDSLEGDEVVLLALTSSDPSVVTEGETRITIKNTNSIQTLLYICSVSFNCRGATYISSTATKYL